MKRTFLEKCLFCSIGIATVPLVAAYVLTGLWIESLLVLAFGGLWLYSVQQERAGASLFLIGFIGFAVWGVRMNFPAILMLISVIAALSAWDIQHFMARLKFAPKNADMPPLERRHLRRLLMVDAIGFVLAGAAMTITIKINFGVLLFLTALAVVSLSRFISFLRNESD